MRTMVSILAATLALGSLVPPPATAADAKSDPFGRPTLAFSSAVSKLPPGTPLTLYRVAGDTLRGKFEAFDSQHDRLFVSPVSAEPSRAVEVSMTDVLRVQYRTRVGPTAAGMLGGLFLGGLAGLGVSVFVVQAGAGQLDFSGLHTVLGITAACLAAGLVAGAVASTKSEEITIGRDVLGDAAGDSTLTRAGEAP